MGTKEYDEWEPILRQFAQETGNWVPAQQLQQQKFNSVHHATTANPERGNPMSIVQSKPASQSWTIWFNVLTLVSAVLVFLSNHEIVAQYPGVVSIMGAAVGVINIVLRFKTNQPLTPLKKQPPQ
jgi:type II secretory pathway component PulL